MNGSPSVRAGTRPSAMISSSRTNAPNFCTPVIAPAPRHSPLRGRYLVLNFVGSAILAVLAFIDQQWGFLLLEGVWALVSLWSLAQLVRGRAPTPPGH